MSVKCKACGVQVPAEAKTCPGCGVDVAAKTKLLPIAAFMLIVILMIQSYINKSEDTAAEAKSAVPVSSVE